MSLRIKHPMYRKWIIWAAIALHIAWAPMLLFSAAAAFPTSTSSLVDLCFGQRWLATIMLLAVSLFAIIGMTKSGESLLWFMPQQAVLMITMFGAFEAIYLSQFPDGVVRSRAFIATDQIGVIIIAIFHTTALIEAKGGVVWKLGLFRREH